MDGGKGGQTQSLQEREGENRRQSANRGRNGQLIETKVSISWSKLEDGQKQF